VHSPGRSFEILKPYVVVKKYYFWPGMKIDVKKYVKRCLLCPMNKVKQAKYPCFVVIIDNT
jgi:hypothetical protein